MKGFEQNDFKFATKLRNNNHIRFFNTSDSSNYKRREVFHTHTTKVQWGCSNERPLVCKSMTFSLG